MAWRIPERFRVNIPRSGPYGTHRAGDPFGVFQFKRNGVVVRCIAGRGDGWEHVSVSTPHRVPTWDEMCIVKSLFWDAEDTVMQLHPPQSQYVNDHPHVLHLWRPIDADIPAPPIWMV